MPSEDLFDPGKVDLVGQNADGVVQLFIVRERPWTGSDEELVSLQHKVHSYVAFAADGQLGELYPDVAASPWQIVIRSYGGEPDPRAAQTISQLAERLPAHGGSLVSETMPRQPSSGSGPD